MDFEQEVFFITYNVRPINRYYIVKYLMLLFNYII